MICVNKRARWVWFCIFTARRGICPFTIVTEHTDFLYIGGPRWLSLTIPNDFLYNKKQANHTYVPDFLCRLGFPFPF